MTKAHQGPEAERVWEDFRSRLSAMNTYLEALELAAEGAPPPETPGREFYANLAFFLRTPFEVPVRASYAEKALYLDLIRRLDGNGQLKPGVAKQAEDALRRAMAAERN